METEIQPPAQSATTTESTEVERVTAPSPTARTKDPKKQAAGRAGAAARKTKQERLLEELRTAKEAIAPAATPVADEAPKEQPVTQSVKQQPMPAPADPACSAAEAAADWTPWILVGAGLAALCVWHVVPMSRSLTPSGASQPDGVALHDGTSTTPRCAQHLKVPDDPFYMAWCAIMSSTPTQKNIVNDLYHAAVVGGLAIGYAKLGQMVFKGPLPRLDLTPRDAGMAILYLSAAMATKDMLIKQGLIPSDIVK